MNIPFLASKTAEGSLATGMTVAKAATVKTAGVSSHVFILPKSAMAFSAGIGLGAISGVLLATAAVVIFSMIKEDQEEKALDLPQHGNL